METLIMSVKERKRMVLLAQVKEGSMSIAQAGRVMGVCYRQAKRIWHRFKKAGDAGLLHQGRGKPGPRRKKDVWRARVLARYQERYPDFGPTLAAEKMHQEGLEVDHETLRRWLLEKGLWSLGRKGRKHRSWRERKECFGQMVQMDGSHHDWFEGRREKAVLMVMVDDATNRTVARFFEEESTRAAYDVLEVWAKEHGLPSSLYVDRDSIYRCERVATVAEQVAGKEPRTQFGRAMEELAVELILAHSPQAKGRVERRNGLLQDRLVKEMRLEGVNDLKSANTFLERKFLPALNKKFNVQARSAVDVHRRVPGNMDEVLSWEHPRVVAKDWTVAWEGRWFQIAAAHERMSLVDCKVIVRHLRCGEVQLLYEGKKLHWSPLPARPQRVKEEPRLVGRTSLFKPKKDHPWRKGGLVNGKPLWSAEKTQQKAVNGASHQAGAASAQPSLRSGFPTAAPA
jgi:transposase